MSESFKNCGKKVFVIFADGIQAGEIFKTNTNARGVVDSFRVRLPNAQSNIESVTTPITVTILKSNVFDNKKVADKALFIYKLKGEI